MQSHEMYVASLSPNIPCVLMMSRSTGSKCGSTWLWSNVLSAGGHPNPAGLMAVTAPLPVQQIFAPVRNAPSQALDRGVFAYHPATQTASEPTPDGISRARKGEEVRQYSGKDVARLRAQMHSLMQAQKQARQPAAPQTQTPALMPPSTVIQKPFAPNLRGAFQFPA